MPPAPPSLAWLCALSLALCALARPVAAGADPIDEAASSSDDASSEAGAAAEVPPRRPLSLAPIGIESDEVLERGDVRLSYRYRRSSFDGLLNNSSQRSPSEVFAGSAVTGLTQAPLRMLTEDHEFGVFAAPHDRLTLRAAIAYRRLEMDVLAQGASAPFKLRAEGFGDLRLGFVHEFMEKGSERLDVAFDVVAPTGAIRVSDDAPQGRERVPYALRPGSGSWSLATGLNYQGRTRYLGWGGQVTSLFRLNRNDLRYKEGNRYSVSGWVSQAWAQWLNTSQRIEWSKWANVHGSDDDLSRVTPANDPKAQGGELVAVALGLELAPRLFGRQRLGFEAGIPVVQTLDGPQLEQDWWLQVGWRTAF